MADEADQVTVGGNSEGSLMDGVVTQAECGMVASEGDRSGSSTSRVVVKI